MNKTEVKVKAAKALEDTADFLKRKNRWCTGAYSTAEYDGKSWDNPYRILKENGASVLPGAKFCAVGALAVFCDRKSSVFTEATEAIMRVPFVAKGADAGSWGYLVEDFNDSQETKGPVMRAMRSAARLLMKDLENV